jgi:hypothetical protein
VTSLGTDFEMHAYVQGYYMEHLVSASTVTHLFEDGDPDADYRNGKASKAKVISQTEKPHGNRESSQAQEGQLKVIAMTNELDQPQMEAEAIASKAYELIQTITTGKAQGTYRNRIKY